MKRKIRRLYSLFVVMILFISLCCMPITAEAKKIEGTPKNPKIIVIDPGCQSIENSDKESVAPGSWSRTTEDMVGAKGVNTKINEYDINLMVANKLEKVLSKNGYKVSLTRVSNDVDMNNLERSMFANTSGADLYISIHCSAPSEKISGITVICETVDNPYNFGNYSNCRLLADTLLGSIVEITDAKRNDVIETDELLGINWCSVPNAVVEIGNLQNEKDEALLTTDDYQCLVAEGIAAGIDSYFSQK